MLCRTALQAQPYKKRVLFYGPTLTDKTANGQEIKFINNHADEFEPVDTSNLTAPGKSQVWNDQQWISAALADFQQFDAIVISDVSDEQSAISQWNAATNTRAIWGSAINGQIFITSGDPVSDVNAGPPHVPEIIRVFRQGVRFASAQAGNSHGRTGLYVALGHLLPGETLGTVQNPTTVDLLSWFGSFQALKVNNPAAAPRLVTSHPIFNLLEKDVFHWSEENAPGFISWPPGYYPIAQLTDDPNPTPQILSATGPRAKRISATKSAVNCARWFICLLSPPMPQT